MCVNDVVEALQAVGGEPVVIAGAVGYIAARALGECVEIVVDHTFVGRFGEQFHLVGVAGSDLCEDGAGGVGGAVIAHYHLVGEVALLREYAFESSGGRRGLVVCEQYN